jgi:RNA polymerase sigma-70 factor (ECF subfamily)
VAGAIPDELLGIEDGYAAPEARYEQREAVELAFVAANQYLPARQRAMLILREVLGFSAREVADALETSAASANSALQRARKQIEVRLPARSQQATLCSLGDELVRELVQRYVDAWEKRDVDALIALLVETRRSRCRHTRTGGAGATRSSDSSPAWASPTCAI